MYTGKLRQRSRISGKHLAQAFSEHDLLRIVGVRTGSRHLAAMDPFHLPPKLLDLLGGYDVYGQEGSQWLTPRSNLLIDNVKVEWKDDQQFLCGNQVVAEGSSKGMYINRCFPGLPDRSCKDQVRVSCCKPLEVQPTRKMLL